MSSHSATENVSGQGYSHTNVSCIGVPYLQKMVATISETASLFQAGRLARALEAVLPILIRDMIQPTMTAENIANVCVSLIKEAKKDGRIPVQALASGQLVANVIEFAQTLILIIAERRDVLKFEAPEVAYEAIHDRSLAGLMSAYLEKIDLNERYGFRREDGQNGPAMKSFRPKLHDVPEEDQIFFNALDVFMAGRLAGKQPPRLVEGLMEWDHIPVEDVSLPCTPGEAKEVECSVCYEKADCVKTHICKHVFCKDCLRKWLNKKPGKETGREQNVRCPYCRRDLCPTPRTWPSYSGPVKYALGPYVEGCFDQAEVEWWMEYAKKQGYLTRVQINGFRTWDWKVV